MLWATVRPIGRFGLLVTSAALAANADVPRAILSNLIDRRDLFPANLRGKILTVLLARPAPLALLTMSVFFLWVYMRRSPQLATMMNTVETESTAAVSFPA